MEINYHKKARNTAKRIAKLIKTTKSPFVTRKVLRQWIENAILTAYHEGKTDVDREHQRQKIEEALKAFRKVATNGEQRPGKVDRRS